MFTGIIGEVGHLQTCQHVEGADARFEINAPRTSEGLSVGASVACHGICLTATDVWEDGFAVNVSAATMACTTCGDWSVGQAVHLERALRVGDELGGHFVFGHVDAVGLVRDIQPVGESLCVSFTIDSALSVYIAAKGSVTVDGVSLTVNQAGAGNFALNIVPHTRKVTHFAFLKPGDRVNVEVDMLARYVIGSVAGLREPDTQ